MEPAAVAMAVDRIRLAGALTAIVAERPTRRELPDRLCAACVAALPVDGVGLSLMTRGEPGERMPLGASDATGTRIEELQLELGEGPSVSAFSEARPMLVSDLLGADAQQRWPMFTRAAPAIGARSLFAFPLMIGMAGIGVMDCHRTRSGPLRQTAEALAVADAVTMALLNLQARERGQAVDEDADLFDLSWRSHAVVHQATGVLAAQFGIPTDEAFALLRARAFRLSRPLQQLAADVVTGRLRLAIDDA
jgi:ANTAR domain